jgi:hypothetical protein
MITQSVKVLPTSIEMTYSCTQTAPHPGDDDFAAT